jgi:uncharacterized membrane protein
MAAANHPRRSRIIWSLFWIMVGVFLLLVNHDVIPRQVLELERNWPVVFVVLGVMLLLNMPRGVPSNAARDAAAARRQILEALQRGEITNDEAARRLGALS